MRGVRLVRYAINHLLGIAMVSSDDDFSADGLHRLDHAADADIQRFDGLGGRFQVAAMADHVAVGIVADDRRIFAAQYRSFELVRYLKSAHLWLQVIGGNPG